MGKPRIIIAVVALIALAIGLNLAVLTKDFFTAAVLGALAVALVAGVVWMLIAITGAASRSRLEGRPLYGLSTVVSSVLVFGICVVLYAFVQHWNRSWDLTQEGRRELSSQTVQVLETLGNDVDVLCFFLQVDDNLVRIAKDKTERFLAQCAQHTSLLNIEFHDPQVARAQLEGLGVPYASPQGTVVVRCGKNQRVITLKGASPRLEEREFTNALINVVRNTQPKICFLTGHGERDVLDTDEKNGASLLETALKSESYLVERIGMQITAPSIPEDCGVLVINGLGLKGPQADLHPAEIGALQEYLERGGRLLMLLDPWLRTQPVAGRTEQLRPWLKDRYGIVIGDDVLISPETKWTVELRTSSAPFGQAVDEEYQGCFNAMHPVTKAFDQNMVLNVCRSVTLAETRPPSVAGTSLLRTTPEFWAETDVPLLFKAGKAYKQPDEVEGALPVAVAVAAKTDAPIGDGGQTRDARIVVVGDSDFATNGQFTVVPGHLNFFLNAMAWLTESEELIAIRPSGKEDPPVLLTEGQQRAIVWISVLGTLQVIAAVGLIAHGLRRKYR
ncbi:MAG TPA: GldG family protein [Candidatus Hydrogenedentes bacterium]|nr:GldG family protein [Candidatus Hydrogenedentota bacterium]HPG66185.1 GldG family protein [Candidatus Hydrogenedentota bacterium]